METFADNVENRILQYLSEKRFSVGDLLPKEMEISKDLQVSRHIVREGISRLKAIGVVESRKRRGTVICRPSPFLGFEKIINTGLYDTQDQKHYMELRVAIELGMSSFVYNRKTPEKIAALRQFAGVAEDSRYDFDTELDFHTHLIAMAENPAANDFRRILVRALSSFSKSYSRKASYPPSSHMDICDALENGSIHDFHAALRGHFIYYLGESVPE